MTEDLHPFYIKLYNIFYSSGAATIYQDITQICFTSIEMFKFSDLWHVKWETLDTDALTFERTIMEDWIRLSSSTYAWDHEQSLVARFNCEQSVKEYTFSICKLGHHRYFDHDSEKVNILYVSLFSQNILHILMERLFCRFYQN